MRSEFLSLHKGITNEPGTATHATHTRGLGWLCRHIAENQPTELQLRDRRHRERFSTVAFKLARGITCGASQMQPQATFSSHHLEDTAQTIMLIATTPAE